MAVQVATLCASYLFQEQIRNFGKKVYDYIYYTNYRDVILNKEGNAKTIYALKDYSCYLNKIIK